MQSSPRTNIMSAHHQQQQHNSNDSTNSNIVAMSLERKLELLESRFTRPSGVGTLDASEPLFLTSTDVVVGHNQHAFSTQHSFSFGASNHSTSQQQQQQHQHSNLPSSSVRSRRRPSLHSTFHAVERATARHLRKLAANSPTQGTTSNLSTTTAFSLHSTSSQQTLLTSHVQPRIVAESPPVPVTPGISTTPATITSSSTHRPVPSKPGAARTLLPSTTSKMYNDRSSRRTSISDSADIGNDGPTTAYPTNSATGKRKSVPKRKHSSILDRSQVGNNSLSSNSSATSNGSSNHHSHTNATALNTTITTTNSGYSPEPSRRVRKSNEDKTLLAISEASRDRSNSAKVATSSNNNSNNHMNNNKKNIGPSNNRSIHDFFSSSSTSTTSSSHKKGSTAVASHAATGNNGNASNTPRTGSSSALKNDLTTDQVDWAARCQKLEQLLQDKDEQLKAVTDNKTILHTALQSALEKTKNELENVRNRMDEKNLAMSTVLEDLLRWKSNQQAKNLRETLAADGARLGRIVYARAGMRALESWEEGYATKDLEYRKQALATKRDALEARSKHVETMTETDNTFEGMEAREAIRMHIDNLKIQELELSKEEQALNDEKGAHIRALKRVASEDASRFRHRPKLHDRYVLHCLLGKGGFSEVWRGYDLVELREVAVKIHQLDPRWPDSKKENYTKHVSREYEIHRNVRHPRIVSLYDVFEIDNNSFATVLECCKGTDLDTILKSKRRLPERQARALLLQILSGMNYLSQPSGTRQGIIHYDLKPGNILFDEFGDAKITDFGLSKIVDTQDSTTDSMELTSQGAGTYWYLPPECFITTERVRISNKVDVWSIGVIYFQMLYGSRPFGEGQSQDKLLSDHTMLNAHQVNFPDHPEISPEGKAFIKQCLMYDQAFRPTIAQLCEQPYVVKHEFS